MPIYTTLLLVLLVLTLSACGQPPASLAPNHEDSEDHRAMASILRPDEGEKLHMHGERYVILKVSAEQNGARQLLMGTEALPPGSAIPVHSHDGYEEIIFIHQGDALVTVGDTQTRVEPGTTLYVPAGAWHGVASTGDSESTMLFIFPETEIAEFFRSVGYKEGETPPQLTPEDWAQIMQQHRMRARR